MPTDNVTANAGSGGATFRTFADASSNEWPASVVCYATTISAGANVLVPVDATHPLPIVLTAGSAVVGHVITDSGSVTAATQSGTWNVTNISGTVSLPTNAAQETGGNLASIATNTGRIPAQGQALAAASMPVVLTAAQLSTLTPLSTVAATQSGTWNITNVSGTVSLPTGAATAAKQPALGTAGSASTDVITVQGITSMTALKVDGSAVTQPVSGAVNIAAATTGGCSMFTMVSAASNNSTQVKASAGTIKAIVAINTTATIYYLKIFDGSPTMGTTSANWNIPIPANTSGAGVAIPLPPEGLGCSSTINIALTGAISLTDNTSAATGVAINIGYK